jgi:hypothetical protein
MMMTMRMIEMNTKEHAMTPDGDLLVDEKMGGEIGKTIQAMNGKQFTCTCNHTIQLYTFAAYPHYGGLADKDGKRWWLYVTCSHCNYEWSWHKILSRLLWGKHD